MDSYRDFPPAPQRRASDPSLEEMLRRARDAHLGTRPGTTISQRDAPRFRHHLALGSRMTAVDWLHSVIVLATGMLLGALLVCGIVQAGVLGGVAPTQGRTTAQGTAPAPRLVPTSPAATPLPTTTSAPVLTPTEMPTATVGPASPPPTIDEIVSSAQDFYNSLGSDTGAYVFVDATAVQLQSLDATQLTACIAFDVASVASPDTVTGSDTRSFVLEPTADGTWQVVEMGGAASCDLS